MTQEEFNKLTTEDKVDHIRNCPEEEFWTMLGMTYVERTAHEQSVRMAYGKRLFS